MCAHTPAFRFFLLALAFLWVTLALRTYLFSIYIYWINKHAPNKYTYTEQQFELPTGMRHRNPDRKEEKITERERERDTREVKREITNVLTKLQTHKLADRHLRSHTHAQTTFKTTAPNVKCAPHNRKICRFQLNKNSGSSDSTTIIEKKDVKKFKHIIT